jgi:Na+-driven multidrug efflux pump
MTTYDLIFGLALVITVFLSYLVGYYFGKTDEQEANEIYVTKLINQMERNKHK